MMPEGGAVLLEAGEGLQGFCFGAEEIAVEVAVTGWDVSVLIDDVVVLVTVGHFRGLSVVVYVLLTRLSL
ncbi:Hypothetical protein Cul210931_1837 [Corynebacterium ulcerans]|nr:Hypothetical protein Cul210931_1837 [Corynebacterium ulcerans]